MKKICILSDVQWVWGEKLRELQEFWKPIEELKIDIFSIVGEIPFESAEEILVGSFMPEKNWYETLALQYPNYDEYLLVISKDKWKGNTAQGWIFGEKFMSITSDENSKVYFKDGTEISEFFWFASHELSHNFCQDKKILDRTHEFFDLEKPNYQAVIHYLLNVKPDPWALIVLRLQEILRLLGILVKKVEAEGIPNLPKKEPPKIKRKLENLALAIARVETDNFRSTSLPMRLNNPLALKFASQPGSTKEGQFARFKTYDEGWQAGLRQLIAIKEGRSKHYNINMTIQQFISKWAPSSDNNHVDNYVNRVIKELKITPQTLLKDILL